LKGFQKVALAPGEVKTLTFSLTPRPRLNADTHLSHILQDPRGRAVIERYLAQSVPMSELNRFADRLTLNRMSLSFMEILPPDLLATITAELAKID